MSTLWTGRIILCKADVISMSMWMGVRRNRGGEFENVAILVAIAVNADGYHEVLGAAEDMKEYNYL